MIVTWWMREGTERMLSIKTVRRLSEKLAASRGRSDMVTIADNMVGLKAGLDRARPRMSNVWGEKCVCV